MGVQEKYIGNLEFDNSNIRSTFLLQDVGQAYGNRAYEERELWSLSQTPEFVPTELDVIPAMFTFLSIPLYARIANCAV